MKTVINTINPEEYDLIVGYPFGSRLWGYNRVDSDYDYISIYQIPTNMILKGIRVPNKMNKDRYMKSTTQEFYDIFRFEIQSFIWELARGRDPHYLEVIHLDKPDSESQIWIDHKDRIKKLVNISLENRNWIARQVKWANGKLRHSWKEKNNALYIFRSLIMLKTYHNSGKVVSTIHDVLNEYPDKNIDLLLQSKLNNWEISNSLWKKIRMVLIDLSDNAEQLLNQTFDQQDTKELAMDIIESFRLSSLHPTLQL